LHRQLAPDAGAYDGSTTIVSRLLDAMNKDLGPKVAAGLKWAGTVTDLPNTEAVLVGEIEKLINKAGGKRSVGNSQSVILIDPAQYWWRDIDVPWVGYYITEHIRYLDKEKTIQGKTEKVREVEHAYLGVWRFGLSPTSEYALGPVRPPGGGVAA